MEDHDPRMLDERKLQERYQDYRGVDEGYVHAGSEAVEKFLDRKFGLRIHWGPYCMFDFRESWGLPTAGHKTHHEYETKAQSWNPTAFDAKDWVAMMKNAGMSFFTFTTKHHDGFSMYDTKTRVKRRQSHAGPTTGSMVDCDLAYSIMETPFGRDVTKELVEAGRAADLGVGLYFSHIDWFDSDFRICQWGHQRDPQYTRQSDPKGFERLVKRHRDQIREILTQYGPVDLLSLDMAFPDKDLGLTDDLVETVKMARGLMPRLMMRNRGIGAYGDYESPERLVPSENMKGTFSFAQAQLSKVARPWKVIYPGSINFSWMSHDEYKPGSWILERLVEINAKGGVFQLGYGPDPTGAFHPHAKDRLEYVGAWMKVNREAIDGTRPFDVYQEGKNLFYSRSKDGKQVYLTVTHWPDGALAVPEVFSAALKGKPVKQVKMLGVDEPFKWKSSDQGLAIAIPEWFRDPEKRPCTWGHAFRIDLD